MIYIGAVMLGPEVSGTVSDQCIRAVSMALSDVAVRLEKPREPDLNLIFYIDGSFDQTDWSHSKIKAFSKKKNRLQVAIAFRSLEGSRDEVNRIVFQEIEGAIELADRYLKKKGVEFDYSAAIDVIVSLKKKMIC